MKITIAVTPRGAEALGIQTLNVFHYECGDEPFKIHRNPATNVYTLHCPTCGLKINFFGKQISLIDLEYVAIDSKEREITTGFSCSSGNTQIKIIPRII